VRRVGAATEVGLSLGRRGVGGGDDLAACGDDGFEGRALEVGVSLDGVDEVRDEIETALQLHVDLRPRIVDFVAPPHEAVVREHSPQEEYTDNDEYDDETDVHA
jgi:hypothetical protein